MIESDVGGKEAVTKPTSTTIASETARNQAQSDPSLRDAIQLAMLPGLGPRLLSSLLDCFGDAGKVLGANDDQLARVPGIGKKLVHTIRTAPDFVNVDEILDWCEHNNAHIVPIDSLHYPAPLKELDDAPPLLFVRGDLVDTDTLSVAIVGTRHATAYGLRQAERIAFGLAQSGVTVVSGLARGIDAAAHKGALDAGGRTIAVLGSGLGQMYPREHDKLADRCAASGAVISEQSPHTKPKGGLFPQRNRLIAGLTLATLVIEAPDRSGSLITARLAYEQNRDVLALPGQVTSRMSRGCNQLIRDGATLIQSVDDILEAIGPMQTPVQTQQGNSVRHPVELQLNEIEQAVLQAIEPESTPIDRVITASGLPAHRVIATISVLEMKRLIRRLSGQYVSRV